MTGVLVRTAGFAAIYLLVLTSVHPGDVLAAVVLGLAAAVGLRPRRDGARPGTTVAGPGAFAAVLGRTAVEIVRGTWRTARFCLGGHATPGFVTIPREDRTGADAAVWGVLTGEAPDEIPVKVDEERGVLVVHVLDGADPEAVRARHRDTHRRWQGR